VAADAKIYIHIPDYGINLDLVIGPLIVFDLQRSAAS